MRKLATLEFIVGSLSTIECSPGERVRLTAVNAIVAPGAVGDQVIVRYQRGADILLEHSTEPITGQMTQFSAAVGQSSVRPLETNVDPVTGAVTFNTFATNVTSALPDVWWPFPVDVNVVLVAGGVTSATLIYEREEHAPARPFSKGKGKGGL